MREARARSRLFDDESRYLDRFALLLTVTVLATITLSLVDLGDAGEDLATALAQFTVSLFVGATLLLAVHASGVIAATSGLPTPSSEPVWSDRRSWCSSRCSATHPMPQAEPGSSG